MKGKEKIKRKKDGNGKLIEKSRLIYRMCEKWVLASVGEGLRPSRSASYQTKQGQAQNLYTLSIHDPKSNIGWIMKRQRKRAVCRCFRPSSFVYE
jgi:hypothetical protein